MEEGPGAAANRPLHYVLCDVAGSFVAFALHAVSEVIRPSTLLPAPGTPSFVAGLAIVRGTATPVVDAKRLLLDRDSDRFGRLVVARVADRFVAIGVERVIGVSPLTFEQPPPPLTATIERAFVEQLGALDRSLVSVLDETRLVPRSLLAQLDTKHLDTAQLDTAQLATTEPNDASA